MSNLPHSIDYDAVIAATRAAASLAHESWRDGDVPTAKVWEKTEGQPVCEADLAVDAHLKSHLMQILPEAGWLSEETVDDPARLQGRCTWLVDPIDGTRDYIKGRDGWCVSVALIIDGRPEFGILEAPARGQLWAARAGHGATCNGKSLNCSQRQEFVGSRVPKDKEPDIPDFVTVDKPNSIAMRMAMVACDRADFIGSLRWGAEWDVAAAHLIAEESGAWVSDAKGIEMRYNKEDPKDFGLICCAPDLSDQAVARLAEWAERFKSE